MWIVKSSPILYLLAVVVLVAWPRQVYAQGTVSGYAFSVDTADPVAYALVFLKDEQGLTIPERPPIKADEQGYYEFTDVTPGQYQIQASGTFVDRDGKEFGLILVSTAFPVTDDGAHMYFGFSVTELKMRQAASSYFHTSAERRRQGTVSVDIPRWLSPRLFMIRSKIVNDKGEGYFATSYSDRIPAL